MQNSSISAQKRWVSADDIIKTITDRQIEYELTQGITGKYTQRINEINEALRKEAEAKAQKTIQNGKTIAKEEEEEMVC